VVSPQEYATKLDVVRAAAAEAGRDPQAVVPALHRFLVVGQTDADVLALLRSAPIRLFGFASPPEARRGRNPEPPRRGRQWHGRHRV
jgi:phthiodiolone/phenolphthiodiolone dimycocerosates ketoreductase